MMTCPLVVLRPEVKERLKNVTLLASLARLGGATKDILPNPKQPALPSVRRAMKKMQSRRARFVAGMDAVVPWVRLLALIEPHYLGSSPCFGPRSDMSGLAVRLYETALASAGFSVVRTERRDAA